MTTRPLARPEREGIVMEGYAAAGLTPGIMAGLAGLPYAVGPALVAWRDLLVAPPRLDGAPVHEHAFSRFHLRWHMVSVIFPAFGTEMLFRCPWPLVVRVVGAAASRYGSWFPGRCAGVDISREGALAAT